MIMLSLVLIVAVLIGLQLKTNPGYVIISTNHLMIETRLWFALLSLVAILIVFYGILRFSQFLGAAPRRLQRWRRRDKSEVAIKNTYQGLINLAEGDCQRAQKLLLKKIKNTPVPLVNYLAAAIAAQRDGEQQRRDKYLAQAANAMPDAKLAIGLVQAQLQYEAAQYELSLVTLNTLTEIAPRQKQVLALLAKVYKKLHDWPNLVEALIQAEHYKALPAGQIEAMALPAYCNVFPNCNDVLQLKAMWQHMPKKIQQNQEIEFLYIQALNRLGEIEWADKLLRQSLKREWNSAMVGYYHQIELKNTKKQYAYAEAWLEKHADDAQLLFTLACLAEKIELWEKARDFYAESLRFVADPKVYASYARLLESLGEVKQSLVFYRKGLKTSF